MAAIAEEAKLLPLKKEFTDEYPVCSPREQFVFSTWQMGNELFRRSAEHFERRVEWLEKRNAELEQLMLKKID